jgi:hypothetical protein
MMKMNRPDWLNAPLRTTLREEAHDPKITEDSTVVPNQKTIQKPINKRVGLWINRRKAVIVVIANNIEGRSIITSDMDHFVLYSTVVPGDGSPEEIRDRRFWDHLGEYYEKIMEHLRDAVEILIFGPDEAKFELQKHLESAGLAERIVSVENAGTLTDTQIATKVRKRFPARSQFDIF